MNDATTTDRRKTLSATTLIGDEVRNASGEKLGTLKEIMIDVDHGQLAYGVLDFGGMLGIGDKYFAVPFERFRVDESDEKLVLYADKETLKNAEGFDKNDWPDLGDVEWSRKVHKHYGATPYWERA